MIPPYPTLLTHITNLIISFLYLFFFIILIIFLIFLINAPLLDLLFKSFSYTFILETAYITKPTVLLELLVSL